MKKYVLLLPLLAGCEFLEPYTPDVIFQELSVNDINFEEADIDFVFSVENPNPLEISLASFDYALALQDVELLAGDNQEGFTLESVGSSELRLPVALTWKSAWDTVQAVRGEDIVDFGLDGHFGFDTPIGVAEIPYNESGSFPALRKPPIRFTALRWTGFTFPDVKLALDIEIDNDHGSTFFFDNFDYEISLNNFSVASGLIEEFADVEGATLRTVEMPISIDAIGATASLYEAIADGGALDVDLVANTDVETPFGILPLSIDEAGNITVENDL